MCTYCISFNIPESDVLNIFNDFKPGFVKEINVAFIHDWELPSSSIMAASPYYHILLFIVLIGAKTGNDQLAQAALNLLNFRMYNGRKTSSIPYCDPATMAFVIQNMNKKFICSKFDTPFEMLTNYFTPTIYTKYKSYLLKDSAETKRLFNASFSRLRQLFRSDGIIDLKTGKSIYRSGIQPLYYEAKNKNLKITTTSASSNSDISSSLSGSQLSDDIDSIVHSISMNLPAYDQKFIDYVIDQSTAQKYNVIKILNSLHSLQYHDFIREICESIFRRIEDLKQNEICAETFYTLVQQRIISSKHNPDVNRIKDLCDKLLTDMLKTKIAIPVDYAVFKNTTRAKLRRCVILGVAYNIQKFRCK